MDSLIEFLQEYPIFVGVLLSLIVLLSVLLLFYLITKKQDRKITTTMQESINTVRVFVVDFGNDRATYFNKRDFGKRQSGTLDIFFRQFELNAATEIEQWLENLLADKKNTPTWFEADVNIERKKATFFSLLQVIHINREKEIIYLESHLLQYLTPKNQINKKMSQKARHPYSLEEFDHLFHRAKRKNRGLLMLIRFYKIHRQKESEPDIEKLLLTQLKDRVTLFLTASRVLIEISNMEVAVFDLRSSDFQIARQIARSLREYLNRYIDINGISGYGFTIGVVSASDFGECVDLIDTTREMAIAAEKNPEQIAYYDRLRPMINLDNTFFRKELDLVIKDKRLYVSFRPIVDARSGDVYGYFSYIEPSQSIFNNFNEIKEFALKTERERELFSVMSRNILTKFFNQRTSDKHYLFLNVLISDFQAISNSLSRMNHADNIPLVLLFDEEDVSMSALSSDVTIEKLTKIKNYGFDLGLTISNTELTMPAALYGTFDYFVVDEKNVKNIKKDQRKLNFLLSTLGKLLKYNKEIIVTDLPGWSEIEYMVRSGINLVSAEEIAKKNSMVVPLEIKKITKVNSFTK
ncbi:MAG: hypothetical protein GX343_00260 [Erysipelotrichaceae bacterium]|jgi:hypothetical protein|nr:hypothetical protein [Bacillota bacterium]NLJ32257.1 hypothetical protein [Erysipelotrichaceae bacterium]HOF65441.1 hypothetical protein [Bacilli bacterium]